MTAIGGLEGLAALTFLATVMFGVGLDLPARPLAAVAEPGRKRCLLVLLGLQWLLLPAAGLGLLSIGQAGIWLGSGVVLALAVPMMLPGGKGALAFALLARADVTLVLASALLALALSFLIAPLWFLLALPDVSLSAFLLRDGTGAWLVLATLLPLLLGWRWRGRSGTAGLARLRRATTALVLLMLVVIVTVAILQSDLRQVAAQAPRGVMAVILLHVLFLSLTELVGRVSGWLAAQRRGAQLAVGVHNSAVAVPLVALLAPGDVAALATVSFWAMWRLLVAAAQSFCWRRFARRPATDATTPALTLS